jgi:hypothetical protein
MRDLKSFVPREQSLCMLHFSERHPFYHSIIGREGFLGVRYKIGRILIESYNCQKEPLLEEFTGLRIVLWSNFQETEASNKKHLGWRSLWSMPLFDCGRQYGIGKIHPGYLQDWKGNTRRGAVKAFQGGVTIQRVSIEDLAKEYHASGHLDFLTRVAMLSVVKAHIKTHSKDVHLLLAYHNEVILGGAVFIDLPDIKQSIYTLSFMHSKGRQYDAGYAYIFWWYQYLIERGFLWADFGLMWQKGDPRGWQGSSAFKQRFGLHKIQKKTHWKITRS